MALANPYNYKKPKGYIQPAIKTPSKKTHEAGAKQPVHKNGYLEQKIMSAKPQELTLMLYEGVVKFIKKAKLYNEQNNIEKTNNMIIRAEAIITELQSTLNMDYEISKDLADLYEFITFSLTQANIEKDNKYLDDALVIAEELRDTWKQAMESLK